MTERTNEESLELFADLLEPAVEIITDPQFAEVFANKEKPIKAVKVALKNHKAAVIEMLARLDGEDPENYKVNILQLPIKALNFLNRPEIQELFTLQGQKDDAAPSGSATENTGDGAN